MTNHNPHTDRHPLVIALKGRRLALGLTQRQLADRLDTTQATVSDLETGRYRPTLRTIDRWARALDCELVLVETGNDLGATR